MKPVELVSNKEVSRAEGYSSDFKTFTSYKDEDVVVAYRRAFMGVAILIKGKRDFFGFVFINKSASKNNWCGSLYRKNLRSLNLLFEEEGGMDKVQIIDKELYQLFNKTILFMSIGDDKNGQ